MEPDFYGINQSDRPAFSTFVESTQLIKKNRTRAEPKPNKRRILRNRLLSHPVTSHFRRGGPLRSNLGRLFLNLTSGKGSRIGSISFQRHYFRLALLARTERKSSVRTSRRVDHRNIERIEPKMDNYGSCIIPSAFTNTTKLSPIFYHYAIIRHFRRMPIKSISDAETEFSEGAVQKDSTFRSLSHPRHNRGSFCGGRLGSTSSRRT